jgi:D-galactarolactone cycloisomerase
MKIIKVEPFVVSYKLEESFYFSQWQYDHRTSCLVKITVDDGSYGWGEGYGPAYLIREGIKFFEPFIINRDPLQHENLWQTMYVHSLDYARRGIMLSALSAIDIALWDLKGKILNQPVSTLLGGWKNEKVRVYATGMYFPSGDSVVEYLTKEALKYKEQGFDAMKMKVGLGLKEDIENIRAVRGAIGPDIELMIDANHAFSIREAVQLSHAVEKYNISWFEEPISPEDYNGYKQLRMKTDIPIAAGECEYLRFGFLNIFQHRCVDIAQPDICAAGGITEVKKIAGMAETFGIELIPHVWGTGIALSATLHFLSNLDIFPGRLKPPQPLMELDRTENPLRDELVRPCFVPENGRISVPCGPGLGVDVDTNLLKTFLSE